MANPTPPESPRPVERDEWIAIFVTLATLGGVGFWVLTGGNLRRITPNQIAGVDIPGLAQDGDRPGGSSDDTDDDTDEDTATGRDRGRLQPPPSPERGASERSQNRTRQPDAEEETARGSRRRAADEEDGRGSLLLSGNFSGDSGGDSGGDREAAGESASGEVEDVGRGLGDEARSALESGDLDQETEETPADEDQTEETPAEETPETDSETQEMMPEDELAGIPTPTDDVNVDDGTESEVRPDVSDEVEDPIDFADVEAGNWAKAYIDAMSARGLIEGVASDRFAPEEPVTRAQYARLVQQVFEGNNRVRDPLDFEDVNDDYWAASDIDTAVRLGFLSGYPGPEFRPEQSISRLEVLLSLRAGLNLEDPDNPDEILQAYGDRQTVPDWAKSPISAAIEAELDRKPPDSEDLDLERPATRAEVTAMFYQALVRAGYAEPLP
ncbi:MAG: S-layer homology domain-containing protein [Sodalinema sp.]|uniref:S-layer homology domain-containing protein n=1 Tax=Sodalinema sp. TaxID=3080550 RepID=UPI001229B6FE|nr:MAG: S-layer homology domain-containing protein [Phormidium sp. SL48-SHIP]